MEKYINPFTDWAFKRIFGQEANKDLLINFLNELLKDEQHIVDVQFLDKEQLGRTSKERRAIYDIYCLTDNGKYFILEMQNEGQPHFIDRSIYYAAHSIVGQARKDRKDDPWDFQLMPVYTVCFMNMPYGWQSEKPKKFRTDLVLTDRECPDLVHDKLRFIYLYLPLFPIKEATDCKTNFERWIYILKNMETMEQIPYQATNAAFRKLERVMQRLSLTHEEDKIYERSLRHYLDNYNCLKSIQEEAHDEGLQEGLEKGHQEGLEEGRQQGLEEGRMEGVMETARNLKQMGLSVDQIKQATGLTADEIARL